MGGDVCAARRARHEDALDAVHRARLDDDEGVARVEPGALDGAGTVAWRHFAERVGHHHEIGRGRPRGVGEIALLGADSGGAVEGPCKAFGDVEQVVVAIDEGGVRQRRQHRHSSACSGAGAARGSDPAPGSIQREFVADVGDGGVSRRRAHLQYAARQASSAIAQA
jgi:hypothetical protein